MVGSVLTRAVDAALEATVVGSFSRAGRAVRSHLPGWEATPPAALAGRRVVVTGATSGLGAAFARQTAQLGAEVHVVGRDPDKLAGTVAELTAAGAAVTGHRADLARLDDVRALAAELDDDPVDVLAHIAGVMVDTRQDTADGVELTTQVHVVAPFLLTTLLLDRLRASTDARVLTMSSGGMYTQRLDVTELFEPPAPFDGTVQYARAKRAQVELNEAWAELYPSDGIGFHALHPGWADTPGVEHSLPRFYRLMGPALRTPDDGADTATWLAWTPTATAPGGRFWHDRRPRRTHWLPRTTASGAERARLWDEVTARAGLA